MMPLVGWVTCARYVQALLSDLGIPPSCCRALDVKDYVDLAAKLCVDQVRSSLEPSPWEPTAQQLLARALPEAARAVPPQGKYRLVDVSTRAVLHILAF